MAYALGARSLANCGSVDPRMLAVAKLACTLSTQDFGFTEPQSRSKEYEAHLVATGKSHTMHSHHIVDENPAWAAPGYSGAVDAVPWNGVAFVWEWPRIFPIAAAFKAASLQLRTPVTWGGCWDKLLSEIAGDDAAAMSAASADYVARREKAGLGHFIDGPHFELGRN